MTTKTAVVSDEKLRIKKVEKVSSVFTRTDAPHVAHLCICLFLLIRRGLICCLFGCISLYVFYKLRCQLARATPKWYGRTFNSLFVFLRVTHE